MTSRGKRIVPAWLYDRRTDRYGFRIWRLGSRQYGLVANYMSGGGMASSLVASVWRLHVGYGPWGGVAAGFDSARIRGRIWALPGGRGLGLGWEPR